MTCRWITQLSTRQKYPSNALSFELFIQCVFNGWYLVSTCIYALVYLRCLDIVGILQQDRQYVILICKNTHSLIYMTVLYSHLPVAYGFLRTLLYTWNCCTRTYVISDSRTCTSVRKCIMYTHTMYIIRVCCVKTIHVYKYVCCCLHRYMLILKCIITSIGMVCSERNFNVILCKIWDGIPHTSATCTCNLPIYSLTMNWLVFETNIVYISV